MTNINGLGNTNSVHRLSAAKGYRQEKVAESAGVRRGEDRVEISATVARLLEKLRAGDIRTEKVESIRSQIEAGTYETDDKIDGAIDKLLDDLNDLP